jgi:serine/threonine-protein kinase
LPASRVIHLMRQACAALTEAHAKGMVHRDLKPANLFASVRGGVYDMVKVLDFGLVKPLSPLPDEPDLSTDARVQGTPQYMPPEQATGQTVDPRADLYALGGVAYYLLTGHAPFEGENAVMLLIAQARDPVVPPSRRQPGVPSDLEAVVLRCLAKAPEERYPDASSLSRALASCSDASGWDDDQAAAWWASHETMATRPPAHEDDDPIGDDNDGSDLNGSTDATAASTPPLALPARDGVFER